MAVFVEGRCQIERRTRLVNQAKPEYSPAQSTGVAILVATPSKVGEVDEVFA